LLQLREGKRDKITGLVLQHLNELLDLGDLVVDLLQCMRSRQNALLQVRDVDHREVGGDRSGNRQ